MESIGIKRDWENMHPSEKERIITKLIFSGHATVNDVEELIDEGMSPDQELEMGAPILQVAANQGRLDIVEMLLNRGANPNLVFWHGGKGGRPLTALDAAMSPDANKRDIDKIIK